ncbi:MAG: hypothetical protein GYA36_15970 [Veillonellaceae bacterium]|nr:hypothetical protein [Veillonellaceae bacterium]
MNTTELFNKTISLAIENAERNLTETQALIDKFKNAGFSVSDLQAKQLKAQQQLEQLRALL